MTNDQPLVSIVSWCKNRAPTIRRSIESVLGQSYRNIEFLVQDGASTDGTVEILNSYNDPRVKLVSEPDTGPGDALWKVLNRCQGEFIGTCVSDEELLTGTITKAVEFFRENPAAGAITCDGWVTDETGKITNEFNAGDFNIVDYLFGAYCPFWPGSFFRRQALVDIGLNTNDWTIECLEFEIWCRLGTRHQVKYVPVRMSKYAIHETQLSNTEGAFHEHFDNRAKVIRAMFSDTGFFGEDKVKLNACLYNQLYLLYSHVRSLKLADQEALLAQRMLDLKSSIPLSAHIYYLEHFNFIANNMASKRASVAQMHASRRAGGIWTRIAMAIPASIRTGFSPRLKRAVRAALTATVTLAMNTRYLIRYLGRFALGKAGIGKEATLYSPDFSPRIYHDIAQSFYVRGQIDQALQMWRRAEALEDPIVDGLACQAMLMSPRATHGSLAAAQSRWAARHARPIAALGACPAIPFRGDRRIRIGYCCAWFDRDAFQTILGQVIRHADRERFFLVGYSAERASGNVRALFDDFKITGPMPDADFVRLVRNDRIDICVEISGFSPFNRFSAMASRCAPVQISYLNHTGTSAVPNIDYVLADEVSVPAEHDRFYTEKVWRLPGSFLSYNYDWCEMPPISEPPSLSRKYITFGYFGSGGKVNLELIELWSEVLRRVPGSRLHLRNHQLSAPDNRDFMFSCFRRFGIEPGRLTLLGGADWQTILRYYDEIDISLDTWPYCGGNTIAESLWQGVPVITLTTDRFSGRYGASLLLAAGCGELVAGTPDEYVRVARDLAADSQRLIHFRKNLRSMMKEHGLSDCAKFAKKLDAAYVAMMQRLQG